MLQDGQRSSSRATAAPQFGQVMLVAPSSGSIARCLPSPGEGKRRGPLPPSWATLLGPARAGSGRDASYPVSRRVGQSRAVSEGSDRLAELESFLGTVPGMIYRTRLVPPYDVEFLSDEAGTVAGYP